VHLFLGEKWSLCLVGFLVGEGQAVMLPRLDLLMEHVDFNVVKASIDQGDEEVC